MFGIAWQRAISYPIQYQVLFVMKYFGCKWADGALVKWVVSTVVLLLISQSSMHNTIIDFPHEEKKTMTEEKKEC